MLLHRSRHHVTLISNCDAARCGGRRAPLAIPHEILRQHLQNHAVRLQLHAQGAVHHAVYVALFDRPADVQFHQPAVGALRSLAAHSTTTTPRNSGMASASRNAARMESDTAFWSLIFP